MRAGLNEKSSAPLHCIVSIVHCNRREKHYMRRKPAPAAGIGRKALAVAVHSPRSHPSLASVAVHSPRSHPSLASVAVHSPRSHPSLASVAVHSPRSHPSLAYACVIGTCVLYAKSGPTDREVRCPDAGARIVPEILQSSRLGTAQVRGVCVCVYLCMRDVHIIYIYICIYTCTNS
jgi:hypothetical protein